MTSAQTTQIGHLARWAARILSLLYALFIGIFAFDALTGEWWEAIIGFAIHLLPTFLLLALTVVAWRWDWVGALAFGGFAAWYLWTVGLGHHWSWYAIIFAPAVLVSLLYLTSFLLHRPSRHRRPEPAD